MRTVVIPMAGDGTRFSGHFYPKVLAPVKPKSEPMFVHAVNNLGVSFDRLILITRREHGIPQQVEAHLRHLKSVEIVELDEVTGGPLESVMKARELFSKSPESEELLIANADQAMVWPGDWVLNWFIRRGASGGIPTIQGHSERHSYVRLDDRIRHRVIEVREKQRISERATIGIYWFRNTDIFLRAADLMVEAGDRAPNGEFYVGPVYNHVGGLVLEYPLCEFWSLGEPANLLAYERRDYASMALD